MKEIPLTNSDLKAIVDDDDYERVMKFRWHLSSAGYAQTSMNDRLVPLHRFIMGAVTGQEVDHVKTDNRMFCTKENLRFCTHSQNIANDGPRKTNKLGVKGVDLLKNGKYRATIRYNYKKIYLGSFDTLKEAAEAYNIASRQYFGEFGYQNDLSKL